MYENNEYTNYGYTQNSASEQPSGYYPYAGQPSAPQAKKAKKHSRGMKTVALALACSLVGGCAGAAAVAGVNGFSSGNVTLTESSRTPATVHVAYQNSDKQMTAAEVYAANVNSTVGVTTSVTTTNFWGMRTNAAAAGSGFIISEDGYILSATEGLTNASAVKVSFPDGKQFPASRVGEERASGLCLLKVEATDLPTVSFAQDDTLAVGQSVYCVCNPYGKQLPNVFYDGMLSASGTVEASGSTYTILQTSAQPSGAGYGCPILNDRGQVVGLTTPIGKRLVSGADPCFAVSAADLTESIERFEKNSFSDGQWLGLELEEIPEDIISYYGFPGKVWIVDIAVESKAYGYLCQWDVVTEVDGVEITSLEEFDKLVSAHKTGESVWLTIYRSGSWYRAYLPVMAR